MKTFKQVFINYLVMTVCIIVIFAAISFLFFDGHSESIDIPRPSSTIEYRLNLESDIGRLGCVFEQRRCYYMNLGNEKEKAIQNCKELNYCDEVFKK